MNRTWRPIRFTTPCISTLREEFPDDDLYSDSTLKVAPKALGLKAGEARIIYKLAKPTNFRRAASGGATPSTA